MSILWAWERVLWPPEAIEAEERELRATRDPVDEDETGPPPGRCKACGYEGSEHYCPHCLADTMIVVKRPRAGSNG